MNYLVKIDEGAEKIVIQELIKTKNFKHVSSIWIEINNFKEMNIIKKMLNSQNFVLVKNFKSKLTKDYLFVRNKNKFMNKTIKLYILQKLMNKKKFLFQ